MHSWPFNTRSMSSPWQQIRAGRAEYLASLCLHHLLELFLHRERVCVGFAGGQRRLGGGRRLLDLPDTAFCKDFRLAVAWRTGGAT